MKSTLVLCCCFLGLALAADVPYTSKYDGVDVNKILGNDRVLNNYIKCMLDKGPCTADGRELKKNLPDAMQTGCTKCNEKQKTIAETVINHLIKHRPKDWADLSAKYDPQGLFQKRFEEQGKKFTQ